MKSLTLRLLCLFFASSFSTVVFAGNQEVSTLTSSGSPLVSGSPVMTPDFLLVNPRATGTLPVPLKELMGTELQWHVQRSGTVLGGLCGLQVTIINDTNRAVVVDGDKAKIIINTASGIKNYPCVSVAELQACILPSQALAAKLKRTMNSIIPAAVTVGLQPTIKDVIISKRPVLQRYGTDENRRVAEATRFGKRILWPHEKTQGIVYFKSSDSLAGAKIEIPVNMLFDPQDKAMITADVP